jgi:Tfp pilus assembly protein PilO
VNKILGAVIIIAGIVMGVEQYTVLRLEARLSRLNERYQKAVGLASKSKLLQEQLASLKKEEDTLKKKIPPGEADPLVISRQISSLAINLGLSHLSFEIVPAGYTQNSSLLPASRKNLRNKQALRKDSLSRVSLRMKAECDYLQLLRFINGLQSLSRLVVVKELEIIRKKILLPRQEVILKLEAYNFRS